METEWASKSFQPERTVLRLRLRPYSCGHEILLSMVGSPYIIGGEASSDTLFEAVLICSQTFKEGLRIVQRPKTIRPFLWLWRFLLKGNLNLFLEGKAFVEYLTENGWSPKGKDHTGSKDIRTLKAPRAYRLISFLCARMGMTETDALDFPMTRANAYYAAWGDREGEIDLEGDEEDSVVEHLRRLEERAAKGERIWDF